MLVMVLSFSLVGAAYYDETTNHFDGDAFNGVQEDADIIDTGNVLEYSLEVSENPARHLIEGIYFFNEDSYLSFENWITENNSSFFSDSEAKLGYEFYDKNGWILSAELAGYVPGDFTGTLRTTKVVNDKLSLNNNLSIKLEENFHRNLRTGFTYSLNEKNNFKLSIGRPSYSYVSNFSGLFEDLCLRAALETKINEKFNNVIFIRKHFNNDNIRIIEQIQYVGSDDFYFDTAFEVNTNYSNQFEFESKKALSDNFYLTFDLYKNFGGNGGYWAYPGIQYEF